MDLIIFPECALTGYPPRDIVGADSINANAVSKELEKNREGMLIYDFEKKELDFGEVGRKRYSDQLLRNSG